MRRRTDIFIGLALFALVVVVFQHARHNGLVNYDNHLSGNPRIDALTWENIRWAFTTVETGNWHPLTWLSWQLDRQIYGPRFDGIHLTNVLLHGLSTVLLFAALRVMTGAVWSSAWAAAFFGLHPLHVESVAWVAERKDTLSALFWMLTLLAYAAYEIRPSLARFVVVSMAFALGLMAKPMLVTLPFVLLLLDFWPLGRKATWRVVAEKLPLFGMSVGVSVATMYAQQAAQAVSSLEQLPVKARLANAAVAYVIYFIHLAWPFNLAAFYPLDVSGPKTWIALACAGAIAGVCVAVILSRRRAPYNFVGWFWYLGTLVPVIGLVQVGSQSMADRYMYLPSIGIFIAVVWSAASMAERWRCNEVMNALGAALLTICGFAAWLQVHYWRDDFSLWSRAIAVASPNALAQHNLAVAYAAQGDLAEAKFHFEEALRIRPNDVEAHHQLGSVLTELGQQDHALDHWRQTLRLAPTHAGANLKLGLWLLREGKFTEAESLLRQAEAADPMNPTPAYHLGRAFADQKRWTEARDQFAKASAMKPENIAYRCGLAQSLWHCNQRAQARAEYAAASAIDPAWPQRAAQQAWRSATNPDPRLRDGRLSLQLAEQACEATDFQNAEMLLSLAAAYAELADFDRAIVTIDRALAIPSSENGKQRLEPYRKLLKERRPIRE